MKKKTVFIISLIAVFMGINAWATTDPTVTGTDAAAEAIEVRFSKSLDPVSVKDSFMLKAVIPGVGFGTVAGYLVYDGSFTAKFTPYSELVHNMNYTLTLTGAKDSDGNPLEFNGWSFTGSDILNDDADIVSFPDENLETAIRQAINKPAGDILKSDLQGLTILEAYGKSIENIEGLQYCTDLTLLRLSYNQISDISAVAGLTDLTELYLSYNRISDISPVAGLTGLTALHLYDNRISDISAAEGLTHLTRFFINTNPLDADSCTVYIPQLEDRGINVAHGCIYSCSDINETDYTVVTSSTSDSNCIDFRAPLEISLDLTDQNTSGFECNGWGEQTGVWETVSTRDLCWMSRNLSYGSILILK
ncbi:MAG: hypothetical protein GY749_30540 [Desulfobacteraceae bacterium]|nr:hypothetical protein [Desulfobacteraceae bacterium]